MKRHHESTPDPNSRSQSVTELQQKVDVLERNIRRLQLEHDLLKKAHELLKKIWAPPLSSWGTRTRRYWFTP